MRGQIPVEKLKRLQNSGDEGGTLLGNVGEAADARHEVDTGREGEVEEVEEEEEEEEEEGGGGGEEEEE